MTLIGQGVRYRRMKTIGSALDDCGGRPSGFDYLRIGLSVAIISWHVVVTTYGPETERALFVHAWSPVVLLLVPFFFALSGFLVAGSLFRNSLQDFLGLRAIRIFPALFVEVLIAAFIIGPALTAWTFSEYFSDEKFFNYFLNIAGVIQYELPGLFLNNPDPKVVNQQLWTIPYELECYILLAGLTIIGITHRPRLLVVITIALSFALAAWSVHRGRVGPTVFLEGRLDVLVFLWGVVLFIFRNRVPLNSWLAAAAAAVAWVSVLRYETAYLGTPAMAYLTIWLGLQNPPRTRLIAGADYSYGMYLYGFAIQQSVVHCLPHEYRVWWVTGPLALLLSAFVAYLSWTLVEKKVLEHKSSILAAIDRAISRLRAVMVAISRERNSKGG